MLDPVRILADLARNGHAILPSLAAEQVSDARGWLQSRQVYPGCHVKKGAGQPGAWSQHESQEVLSHHHFDVLRCPHLFEYALSLTDIAAHWLEKEPPVLYSANAFWTRSGTYHRDDIQSFHTDRDDERFLPLFIYLTDVLTPDDGTQEIQVGNQTHQIMGPAGTAFFSDTSRMHRGIKPKTGLRGICWFRWGVTEVPDEKHAYVWDSLEPLKKYRMGDRYPSDPRLQQSIRLMVA